MSISNVETVLVAQSDDHLAAVEEAKRTGKPFESKGATGSNVVPLDVATAIAEAKSLENTYVGRTGLTYAAHLQDYHEVIRENPSYIALSNEEKAEQHTQYSAQLVREQVATDARVREMIAEGYDVSLAVQQANFERANEHAGYSAEFEKNRRERNSEATPVLEMVDETVKLLNSDALSPTATLGERVEEMVKLSSVVVPESRELPAQDALILKDKIISVEEQYADHAVKGDELEAQNHPAVVVLAEASSPEQLAEDTRDAQIAASRITQDSIDLTTYSGDKEVVAETGVEADKE